MNNCKEDFWSGGKKINSSSGGRNLLTTFWIHTQVLASPSTNNLQPFQGIKAPKCHAIIPLWLLASMKIIVWNVKMISWYLRWKIIMIYILNKKKTIRPALHYFEFFQREKTLKQEAEMWLNVWAAGAQSVHLLQLSEESAAISTSQRHSSFTAGPWTGP